VSGKGAMYCTSVDEGQLLLVVLRGDERTFRTSSRSVSARRSFLEHSVAPYEPPADVVHLHQTLLPVPFSLVLLLQRWRPAIGSR
jgi:hypothetical protein